jgi:hypothetical protein
MPLVTQPAFGPQRALAYITIGALIDVWALVWYFTSDHELSRMGQFWIIGFVLSGVTLIVLGLLLGPIGRVARHAELPPAEAMHAQTEVDKIAAANPPQMIAPSAPLPAIPPPPAGTVVQQVRSA